MASTDRYIVNPGGLVSSVTEEHFKELIISKPDFEGRVWREAEADEAAECAARENPVPVSEQSAPASDDGDADASKGKAPKGAK